MKYHYFSSLQQGSDVDQSEYETLYQAKDFFTTRHVHVQWSQAPTLKMNAKMHIPGPSTIPNPYPEPQGDLNPNCNPNLTLSRYLCLVYLLPEQMMEYRNVKYMLFFYLPFSTKME